MEHCVMSRVVSGFFKLGIILALGSSPSRGLAIEGSAHELMAQIQTKAVTVGTKVSVFIFDLDETLIDSTKRKYLSYRDAISEMCDGVTVAPPDCVKMSEVRWGEFLGEKNSYAEKHIFQEVQGVSEAVYSEIFKRTMNLYLSDRWILEADSLMPGAGLFVKELRNLKSKIYFVTSRSRVNQETGTLASLKRLGLLRRGEEPNVILKEEGEKSIDFKKRAFHQISEWSESHNAEIVGVFENEPENMNAMVEQFPDAIAGFMKGALLKDIPVTLKAHQIQDFLF